MARLCIVMVLVASACFTVLAMDDTTSVTSTSTRDSSSTTTASSQGAVTRRVARQAVPDSDESSDESSPNAGSNGNFGSDGSQTSGQDRPQPPFQARPLRQARPRPTPEEPQQQPQQEPAEETTRRQRQARPAVTFEPTTGGFADDQQDQAQAGQPGLEGRHNTQFSGPRRPQPAPRPGQRPGPGPSRPQPQPGPGTVALTLPDGVDLIVGAVQPGFTCDQKIYGYYADTFNDCRLFHVCVPNVDPNGIVHNQQWSFICGNTTRFNQELLVCDHEDNVDCSQAENFYNVNENFGRPEDKTSAPSRG